MGQKVNPVGLRLGINRGWDSVWYAKKQDFGNYSIIKMTSGEVRKIDSRALATIGVLSNPDQKNIKIGKAGRSRWLGRRPHTRGVVKNPVDHPHGGGEGKSAGGRHPVSPTGQSAKGLKTRDNKRTDKFIIRRRKKKRA